MGPVNHLLDRVPTYSNPLKSSIQVRQTNPTKREPDPHFQRTERDSERIEGETGGSRTREDPTRPKGTRLPLSQRTGRDSERGERVISRSQDERRPNPTKRNQTTHSQQTKRDSERGERVRLGRVRMREDPTRQGNQTPTTTPDREGFREDGKGRER